MAKAKVACNKSIAMAKRRLQPGYVPTATSQDTAVLPAKAGYKQQAVGPAAKLLYAGTRTRPLARQAYFLAKLSRRGAAGRQAAGRRRQAAQAGRQVHHDSPIRETDSLPHLAHPQPNHISATNGEIMQFRSRKTVSSSKQKQSP
ncbi:hypothetical protein NPIL_353831 [Nephila pilipes]|uniref:Uncharacterized protein n=1 Tax=Nephila pilipes TaxID=299642 RepID=A0A8X6MS79_NEPPI|nr:hypothetical protein NPIL_353831 [Nephila pilipes]